MLRWYVITGGPCSGKTTVINELSKLGFHTVPELARLLIDKERSNGKKIKEIRNNELEFQEKVLQMKICAEKTAPKDRVVFFDRALPDSIAYYNILNIIPKRLISMCKKKKYRKVFFLEQIPFKKDYARTECKEVSNKLNNLLLDTYHELGYSVITVPVMRIKDRVKFILSHI